MPVHKRMVCGDQKVCIIGEMENYVATMLHAQKFTARHTTLSVLRSLDMLRVGGCEKPSYASLRSHRLASIRVRGSWSCSCRFHGHVSWTRSRGMFASPLSLLSSLQRIFRRRGRSISLIKLTYENLSRPVVALEWFNRGASRSLSGFPIEAFRNDGSERSRPRMDCWSRRDSNGGIVGDRNSRMLQHWNGNL
jgi:hypothetical protein